MGFRLNVSDWMAVREYAVPQRLSIKPEQLRDLDRVKAPTGHRQALPKVDPRSLTILDAVRFRHQKALPSESLQGETE